MSNTDQSVQEPKPLILIKEINKQIDELDQTLSRLNSTVFVFSFAEIPKPQEPELCDNPIPVSPLNSELLICQGRLNQSIQLAEYIIQRLDI